MMKNTNEKERLTYEKLEKAINFFRNIPISDAVAAEVVKQMKMTEEERKEYNPLKLIGIDWD